MRGKGGAAAARASERHCELCVVLFRESAEG